MFVCLQTDNTDCILMVKYYKKKNKDYHQFVVSDKYTIDTYKQYTKATQHFFNQRPNKYGQIVFWQYRKRKNKKAWYHHGQPQNVRWFYSYPRAIAKYLNIENWFQYSGHSICRTGTTLFANSGASVMQIKKYGCWKSSTVAERYFADSIVNKKHASKAITDAVFGNNAPLTSQSEVNVSQNNGNVSVSLSHSVNRENNRYNEQSAIDYINNDNNSNYNNRNRRDCNHNNRDRTYSNHNNRNRRDSNYNNRDRRNSNHNNRNRTNSNHNNRDRRDSNHNNRDRRNFNHNNSLTIDSIHDISINIQSNSNNSADLDDDTSDLDDNTQPMNIDDLDLERYSFHDEEDDQQQEEQEEEQKEEPPSSEAPHAQPQQQLVRKRGLAANKAEEPPFKRLKRALIDDLVEPGDGRYIIHFGSGCVFNFGSNTNSNQ